MSRNYSTSAQAAALSTHMRNETSKFNCHNTEPWPTHGLICVVVNWAGTHKQLGRLGVTHPQQQHC
jgi:hypothetical protein